MYSNIARSRQHSPRREAQAGLLSKLLQQGDLPDMSDAGYPRHLSSKSQATRNLETGPVTASTYVHILSLLIG